MSVVSQELSNQISKKLTKKHFDELTKARKELSEYVFTEYQATIPKPILEAFKDCPKYMRTTSGVYLHGHGYNCNWENISDELPYDGNNRNFHINAKQGAKIQKLNAKIEILSQKYEKLKKDIYHALQSLKTYKRIADQFPEAANMLPLNNGVSTQLVVNLSEIRKELSEI